MREETLVVPAHPEYINGCQVWVKGGTVGEINRRIQFGDPTKGWEGDPRMTLLYYKDTDQWSLVRQSPRNPAQYIAIAVKQPGEPVDDRIIDDLVRYDSRRGYDAHKAVSEHNARVEKAKDEYAAAAAAERFKRFAFEVKKAGLDDL